PTMAKYILKAHHTAHAPTEGGQHEAKPSKNPFARFQRAFQQRFEQFREGYSAQLERVVARRLSFIIVSSGIAALSLVLYYFNGRAFFAYIRSNDFAQTM